MKKGVIGVAFVVALLGAIIAYRWVQGDVGAEVRPSQTQQQSSPADMYKDLKTQ